MAMWVAKRRKMRKRVYLFALMSILVTMSVLLSACANCNLGVKENATDVNYSKQEEKYLFIGDSFCESEYGWANQLADIMGFSDEQWDKKAISGAGFSTTSPDGYTLLDACNQAISAYTDQEKQTITCVILIGGISDTNPLQDTSVVKEGVIDCCSTLKAAFSEC